MCITTFEYMQTKKISKVMVAAVVREVHVAQYYLVEMFKVLVVTSTVLG